MKRFVDPLLTGGAPLYNDDIVLLQENYFDILKGQYSGLRRNCPEGLVISGCVVSANASNFDVTAGIVFLDGDFYALPAQTNIADPSYIVATTDTNDTRIYRDQATKNVFVTKNATTQGSIPGSGQYITINRLSPHKGWIRYQDYYSLANGWLSFTAQPLEFRKNDDGTVSFRGSLQYNSASVTSDLFISNLVAASVAPDMTPGDENPAGGSGAAWFGSCHVTSGALSGIQPMTIIGSLSSGIMQIGITGIVAGDTSATNRTVKVNFTYGTQNADV